MTLSDVLASLKCLPPEAPVRFVAPDAATTAGYHLTEVSLHQVSSIDCGGRMARGDHARLQILDGRGGDDMAAGKMAAILRRSVDALSVAGDLDLTVEFSPGNQSIGMYDAAGITLSDGVAQFRLSPQNPACKPLEDRLRADPTTSRCCG